MKKIDEIIKRLETDGDLSKDEKGVIAMFLKEFMARDREIHGLIRVHMSPAMYRLFMQYAYTDKGEYKIELFNNQ